MNLLEFQKLSTRTMPFNGKPENKIEEENMLTNYSMGLVGEVIEFGESLRLRHHQELMNECGDVLHYCIGLLSMFDEDVNLYRIEENPQEKNLFKYPGEIVEMAKKHVFHRHELDKDLLIHLLYKTISLLYSMFEDKKEIEAVLQSNIDKLKTRYPDKFSVENSIARLDVIK